MSTLLDWQPKTWKNKSDPTLNLVTDPQTDAAEFNRLDSGIDACDRALLQLFPDGTNYGSSTDAANGFWSREGGAVVWKHETAFQTPFAVTGVKTAAYTAAAYDFVPVDVSGGNITITLPTAPADQARVGVKMIKQSGANTVTVQTGGSDVYNVTGGAATLTISLLNQGLLLQYAAATHIWYVQADDLALSQLDLRYAPPFAATGVQTGAYTAAPSDYVPVDTTAGNVTVTLPTAPVDKTRVGVKMVKQAGTNTVSVTAGGTDAFNIAGGGATLTLTLLNQAVLLQYSSAAALWYVQADDLPLAQLDARYARSNDVITCVTPEQYGAVGNGVTDDTTPMQNTMNAAQAAGVPMVLRAAANYLCGTLNVPGSGLRILGFGASTITCNATTTNPLIYRQQAGVGATTVFTGFEMRGVKLIGAGQSVAESIRCGIDLTAVNDVKIVDCEVSQFPSSGIALYGCVRYWIRDNKVTNCTSAGGRNAIHIDGDFTDQANTAKQGDGWIQNNYVNANDGAGTGVGAGGIVVTPTTTVDTVRQRVVITGNNVHNFTSWAGIACEAQYIQSLTVSNNQAYNCLHGISIDRPTAQFTSEEADSYLAINGNEIDSLGLALSIGIQTDGSNMTLVGNVIRAAAQAIQCLSSFSGLFAENLTITGNTCVMSNTDNTQRNDIIHLTSARNTVLSGNTLWRETTGTGMANGIQLQNCTLTKLSANTIRGVGKHGIELVGGSRLDISNNTVVDCNQLNLSADCIHMSGTVATCRIQHNELIDTGTATPAAAWFFCQTSTATYVHLLYNQYEGVPNFATSSASCIATVRGNRLFSTTGYNRGQLQSTPGAVTTLVIPHLLGVAPPTGKFNVMPADANARGAPLFYASADATNITMNFASALAAATQYTWNWWAEA